MGVSYCVFCCDEFDIIVCSSISVLSSMASRLTSPPPISLWITGHLSEVFRPREIKVGHFT
jgi:hypothetical protein